MTIFVNGRFLSKKISGTQRFALELVKAIDRRLVLEDSQEDWVIVTPPHARHHPRLNKIEISVEGERTGHLWEQFDLYVRTRFGILINLANSGPVLHSMSFTIIHDAAVFRTPSNYSFTYRTLHRMLCRVLATKSRIGTVSTFSCRELNALLGINNSFVIPNSCEHIAGLTPSSAILRRLGVMHGEYFIFVGSPSPNKNLTTAISALKLLGSRAPAFIVVGILPSAVFGTPLDITDNNVIFTGYLEDDEIVALYKGAIALLFPSLYEGFGVPPLEAMVLGCPVLASDIPPVREVCADAAIYFDPKIPGELAQALLSVMESPALCADLAKRGRERAKAYSWDRSAELLLRQIRGSEYCKHSVSLDGSGGQ